MLVFLFAQHAVRNTMSTHGPGLQLHVGIKTTMKPDTSLPLVLTPEDQLVDSSTGQLFTTAVSTVNWSLLKSLLRCTE